MTVVSAVIVTYNSEDDIDACLDSLLAQEVDGLEVVVWDNASQDGTVERVRARGDAAVQLVAHDENLGFAVGCNRAVERTSGTHVLLLNPDARMHEGALAALLDFDRRHPEAGLVGGRSFGLDGTPSLDSCWGRPTLWTTACFAAGLSTLFPGSRLFDRESMSWWQRDTARAVGVVTGLLLLARREVWDRLGGFDERFRMYSEDVDLAFRAQRMGWRPAITPAAVVTHEGGASAASSADKLVLLLRGKVTFMRARWSPWAGAAGVQLLAGGVLLRTLGARVLGRLRSGAGPQSPWAAAWERRATWRTPYPAR